MERSIERKTASRAVELGREGDGAGLHELIGLLRSESAEVRRLAVSAIGKLSGAADASAAVASATADFGM